MPLVPWCRMLRLSDTHCSRSKGSSQCAGASTPPHPCPVHEGRGQLAAWGGGGAQTWVPLTLQAACVRTHVHACEVLIRAHLRDGGDVHVTHQPPEQVMDVGREGQFSRFNLHHEILNLSSHHAHIHAPHGTTPTPHTHISAPPPYVPCFLGSLMLAV